MKPVWLLQKTPDGEVFWDTHRHRDCKLLEVMRKIPYESRFPVLGPKHIDDHA